MSAKHIAAEWATFAEQVLPQHAPQVQVQETRRAFYAGAGCILHRVLRLVGDDDDEPSAEDLQMMDDIMTELDEFMADVKRGKR